MSSQDHSSKDNKISITSLPDEFKKAKNKLFYSSLILILIIVFNPTFTGFLGNFSVKVSHYPTIFTLLILFALTWIAFRYISIFSTIFVDNRLLLQPRKALNEIYLLTNNSTQINDADIEFKEMTANLESLKRIHEKLDGQVKIENKHEIKKVEDGHKSKHEQIKGLKIQRNGLKLLIGMDILAPFFTYVIASVLLIWNMQDISEKIYIQEVKKQAEYVIESATLEIKEIKIKQSH